MIGVVVDGIGEVSAVKYYLQRLDDAGKVIKTPYYSDMQPKANPKVIAAATRRAVQYLVRRGATKIIVLIDLEDRDSPNEFSSALSEAFKSIIPDVEVVPIVKHCCLENWMIADTVALREMPKRFAHVERIDAFLQKHEYADRCRTPIALLNSCTIKKDYHKTQDPPRIAERQCNKRVSKRSPSFQKFMDALAKE